MSQREQLEQQLADAGERLARAEQERDEAMAAVRDLALQASGTVPIASVARLANVSRPTIYKWQSRA